MPPESARAVARASPVRREKLTGFRSGFYWLKKCKITVLIIYAPRECPSGSEGFTCKKGKIDRIPFRFLLAEKV